MDSAIGRTLISAWSWLVLGVLVIVWLPLVAPLTGVERVASRQSPSSICTSTRSIPTGCAHATPAIFVGPGPIARSRRGVSIRLESLMGASAL